MKYIIISIIIFIGLISYYLLIKSIKSNKKSSLNMPRLLSDKLIKIIPELQTNGKGKYIGLFKVGSNVSNTIKQLIDNNVTILNITGNISVYLYITKNEFTKLIISVFLRLFFILSLNRIKYIKGEKCKKSSTIEL